MFACRLFQCITDSKLNIECIIMFLIMLFVKFTVNCYSTVEAPVGLKMYLLFSK